MSINKIAAALLCLPLAAGFSSCLGNDDEEDYTQWRQQNEKYINSAERAVNADGSPEFQKIVPSWASGTFSLIKWHNDRALTAANLSPLDNSTVNIKYETYDIEDNLLNSSNSMHQYGDSIYQTRPCDMITGVRAVLPYMHIGDSVSLVMPYTAAYGTVKYGDIKPYSTLKFNIKLVSIPGYEIDM